MGRKESTATRERKIRRKRAVGEEKRQRHGARGTEEQGGRRPLTVGDNDESELCGRRESKVFVGIF
jgi:hypothetical protein